MGEDPDHPSAPVAPADSRRRQFRAASWNTTPRKMVVGLGLVVIIALGAFLRIWALGREPVNADEAIVGLMAHQILHGHFSAFYWGQNYGGGEPYVVALVFAVVGQSSFSLGLTPVLLSAIAAILVWRIGRRLFSPRVGAVAGLVSWVWPESFLWQSTLEYGFRFVVLDVGLGGVLATLDYLDAASTRRRTVDAAAIGLCFGVGWWASPEIVYFAVPAALVIAGNVVLRRVNATPRELVAAAGALVTGALPWIVANLASGGASLRSGPQPDPSFTSHLETLRLHVLPIALGLAVPVSGRFVLPHEVGRAIEYLAAIAAVLVVVVLVRQRRAPVLVCMAVCFPFFYAASPFTWYWQDGRYAIYLVPTAALLGAAGVDALATTVAARFDGAGWRRQLHRAPAVALACTVALTAALTLVDARLVPPFRPTPGPGPSATWAAWQVDASAYTANLAGALRSAGIDDVIAGYWVAEPVTFASDGAVIASDLRYDRQPALLATIEKSRHPSYLFVLATHRRIAVARIGSGLLDPGCAVATDRCLTPGALLRYLAIRGVAARTTLLGDFVAITPDRWVPPQAVFAAAGIPS